MVTHEYELSRSGYRKGLVRDGTVLILDKKLKRYINEISDREISELVSLLND